MKEIPVAIEFSIALAVILGNSLVTSKKAVLAALLKAADFPSLGINLIVGNIAVPTSFMRAAPNKVIWSPVVRLVGIPFSYFLKIASALFSADSCIVIGNTEAVDKPTCFIAGTTHLPLVTTLTPLPQVIGFHKLNPLNTAALEPVYIPL